MMGIDDIMLQVVDALERAGVQHMLVGSYSSNLHGIPRSTEDVDVVVELDAASGTNLAELLGAKFHAEDQMSFETNTGTLRQEFGVEGTEFKVEFFKLSNDPFDRERFRRRQQYEVAGRRIYFPTAEDVIVMKLRWARVKDKEDVRAVMFVQRGNLDWKYIETWCERHGRLPVLQELRRLVE